MVVCWIDTNNRLHRQGKRLPKGWNLLPREIVRIYVKNGTVAAVKALRDTGLGFNDALAKLKKAKN